MNNTKDKQDYSVYDLQESYVGHKRILCKIIRTIMYRMDMSIQ
jgi:hypothetical protein